MMFSELACVSATYALPGETLTCLAALGGTKPPRVRAERGPRTGSGLGG
jgi:hypothetical protein